MTVAAAGALGGAGGMGQREFRGIDGSNARIFNENWQVSGPKRDFCLGASSGILAGSIPGPIAETITVAAAGAPLGGVGGLA